MPKNTVKISRKLVRAIRKACATREKAVSIIAIRSPNIDHMAWSVKVLEDCSEMLKVLVEELATTDRETANSIIVKFNEELNSVIKLAQRLDTRILGGKKDG